MDAIGTVVGQFTDLYEKQEYATAYAYLTQAHIFIIITLRGNVLV